MARDNLTSSNEDMNSESDGESTEAKKKKKSKAEIKIDNTGDLHANGQQSNFWYKRGERHYPLSG